MSASTLRRWTGVPEEVRTAIEPLLDEHQWILPSWIELLSIEFVDHVKDNVCLQIKCNEEYRVAYLNVTASWLMQDPHTRSVDVQHEFLHVVAQPLHTFGFFLMEASVTKGSALETWATEELRRAVEKTACDLEYLLQRIPAGYTPPPLSGRK